MTRPSRAQFPVNRRHLLSATAAASTAALAAPAIAQGVREFTMVTSWPETLPGFSEAPREFANNVEKLTGGKLRINVSQGGKLVPPLGILDAVAAGKAQFGHSTPYYWANRTPAFIFFATVPFGMTADEHSGWLRHGGGQELWDRLAGEHGVKPLPGGNTGVQMGGWFTRELRSLQDLKGLRIRFPGLGGEILKRFGVEPVLMAAADIVPALREGRIDGAEWVAPWKDRALGLHEVCKNYYYPGFHEPSHNLELSVNLKLWESFDDTTRDLLRVASAATEIKMLALFNAQNANSIEPLVKEHGVAFRRFPADMMRTFRRLAPEVIADTIAKDKLAIEVYESYSRFLQAQLRWSEFGDRAYWLARYA
jgi:TRAP-type mannitol/chloroaromatic compound transport system substrate-binding protein